MAALLDEVQDKNVPVSNLLRKAKVLAVRREDKEFLAWINLELEGYVKKAKTPDYRRARGEVKFFHPYYGWRPLIFTAPGVEEQISSRGIGQSTSELEELLRDDSPTFMMNFPDTVAAQMLEDSPFQTKVSLLIGRSALVGILNSVRNRLFDWLLEMEESELTAVPADTESKVADPFFEERRSIVLLNGQEIEISKTKDSDPHYLLAIIFTDTAKQWGYDEIWENSYFRSRAAESDYDPKTDWRKIYNAARSVNEKVAIASSVKDFLSISKTSVAFNKQYFPG